MLYWNQKQIIIKCSHNNNALTNYKLPTMRCFIMQKHAIIYQYEYCNKNLKKIILYFKSLDSRLCDMKKLLLISLFVFDSQERVAFGGDLLVSMRRFPGNPGFNIHKLTCCAFSIIIILSSALSAICIQ